MKNTLHSKRDALFNVLMITYYVKNHDYHIKMGQYAKQKTIKQTSKQLLANFEIQS